MRDPRDCHGGECSGCGGWFRDDEDLNDAMLCESCEADEERYMAEQEDEDDEPAQPSIDWLALAADIAGVK